MATSLSAKDLVFRLGNLRKNPSAYELILLLRSVFNTSTWLGNSITKLFWSVKDFEVKDPLSHINEKTSYILNCVKNKRDISYKKATYIEIFQTIFEDVKRGHQFADYQSELKVPKINCTLVLISGVLNEIFTTPAFERGAEHLKQKLGIKYFSPKVVGTKSSIHNAQLIQDELRKYCDDNPDEKLWILSFSKGGIDSLHFLHDHPDFANDKILGLSTIATPILGSTHVEHKLLQLINKVHNFSDNEVYQYLDEKVDILLKDFQESLSKAYQEDWFKNHHHNLPMDIFYTSLALESKWHESHIWMVLTKFLFQSRSVNDGVVDAENALFPDYFKGLNLGIVQGHHLIGTRSSSYNQEALLEAHIIFLNYLGLIN